jgi:hypothetical protein
VTSSHLQGEAIAYNLREMFGLRVPVISVVIGEGGSGGALAIGCANKNLIMENSVYYVASPEACAAILWKSRSASKQVRPDSLLENEIALACKASKQRHRTPACKAGHPCCAAGGSPFAHDMQQSHATATQCQGQFSRGGGQIVGLAVP